MSREQTDMAVLVTELRNYQAEYGNPSVPVDAQTAFAFTDPSLVEARTWKAHLRGGHELMALWAEQPTDQIPEYGAPYGIFIVGLDVLGVKLGPDDLSNIARAIGHDVLGECFVNPSLRPSA